MASKHEVSKCDASADLEEMRQDTLDAVLGNLQGMLFEPFQLDTGVFCSSSDDEDDTREWNSFSSKESTFRAVVKDFESQCIKTFNSNVWDEDEGFTHEHQNLHKKYSVLIESKIEGVIKEAGFTVAGFARMVEETDTKDLEDTKGEIMEILRRVSDFRFGGPLKYRTTQQEKDKWDYANWLDVQI